MLFGKRGIFIICQYGDHYFNKKLNKSDSPITKDSGQPSQPKQVHSTEQKQARPKLSLQGTRKIGCNAGIHIREYILYPDYKVSSDTQNKWQLRKAQDENLTRLRQDLNDGKAVKTVTKYYVSLPSEEAHHKSHKTGGMHAMAQRVHPKVIMKIHELVGAGIYQKYRK